MLRYKIIVAGALVIRVLYSGASPRDGPQVRADKKKGSSLAQQLENQKASWQKLELLLACNFPAPGSGLVAVLTFDDDHKQRSRRGVQRRFAYFLKKLRAARRRAGLPEPRVFWAPEVLTSASGRWHVHMVLDSTGRDIPMIRACWGYGSEIQADKLRVDAEKNHETLARYMSKELREAQEFDCRPGLHGWSCTRNVLRPEIETMTVPEDFTLDRPPGYDILLEESRQTQWARYEIQRLRARGGVLL